MKKINKANVDIDHINSVVNALRELERHGNPMFSSLSPIPFFSALADEQLNGASIELQVKKAILITDGNPFLDPDKLPNDTTMDTFGFNTMQNMKLAQRLTTIRQSTGNPGVISGSDVAQCDTVQDCIDLVTK